MKRVSRKKVAATKPQESGFLANNQMNGVVKDAIGTWDGSVKSEGTVFNMPGIKIGNCGASTFMMAF